MTAISPFLPNLVAACAVGLVFIDWVLSDLRSWNREVEVEEKSRFDDEEAAAGGNSPDEKTGAGRDASTADVIDLSPAGTRLPFWAMLVFSVAILGVAGYIVFSGRFDASGQRWAFGAGGLIIGYWLRPA